MSLKNCSKTFSKKCCMSGLCLRTFVVRKASSFRRSGAKAMPEMIIPDLTKASDLTGSGSASKTSDKVKTASFLFSVLFYLFFLHSKPPNLVFFFFFFSAFKASDLEPDSDSIFFFENAGCYSVPE